MQTSHPDQSAFLSPYWPPIRVVPIPANDGWDLDFDAYCEAMVFGSTRYVPYVPRSILANLLPVPTSFPTVPWQAPSNLDLFGGRAGLRDMLDWDAFRAQRAQLTLSAQRVTSGSGAPCRTALVSFERQAATLYPWLYRIPGPRAANSSM